MSDRPDADRPDAALGLPALGLPDLSLPALGLPASGPPVTAAFAAVRYGALPDRTGYGALTRLERASLGQPREPERAAAVLAAKQAVRRLFPQLRAQDVEVLRRQHSAPVLRVRGLPGAGPGLPLSLALSLSHGDGLAVAAVLVVRGDAPCER